MRPKLTQFLFVFLFCMKFTTIFAWNSPEWIESSLPISSPTFIRSKGLPQNQGCAELPCVSVFRNPLSGQSFRSVPCFAPFWAGRRSGNEGDPSLIVLHWLFTSWTYTKGWRKRSSVHHLFGIVFLSNRWCILMSKQRSNQIGFFFPLLKRCTTE